MAEKMHTPEEKARLVLECLRGERTIYEIASENNVHPNSVMQMKIWLSENGVEAEKRCGKAD